MMSCEYVVMVIMLKLSQMTSKPSQNCEIPHCFPGVTLGLAPMMS